MWTTSSYNLLDTGTAQKTKFSIKDFFSKCGQIYRKLRIWSHLLKKSLKENFIFCGVRTKLNVHKTSRTSPEHLMYLQFMSFVQGVPLVYFESNKEKENKAIKMETSSVNKIDIFDIYVKLRVVFFYKFWAFSYTVFLNLFHTHTWKIRKW